MNNLKDKLTNNNLDVKRIVTLLYPLSALLLTLCWFLPVAKIFGESYSMLKLLKEAGNGEAKAGFWFIVILCAVSIVWAVLSKKWAAIAGAIYTILPMIFCIVQVSDWKSKKLDLAVGANLLIPLSILVFVLALAKLLFVIQDGRQAGMNTTAER